MLVDLHCQDESFEVDFVEEEATESMIQELSKLGCIVDRHPYKTILQVKCPSYRRSEASGRNP